MLTKLESETPNFYKWAKNLEKVEAVNYIWKPEVVAEAMRYKMQKMKAAAIAAAGQK